MSFKAKRTLWIFSTMALLVCWLVPTAQAQNNITANPGVTKIYQGLAFTTTQSFNVSLPANGQSFAILLENADPVQSVVVTSISFATLGIFSNATLPMGCVNQPLSVSGSSVANSTFTNLTLTSVAFANFSCPYPVSQKFKLTVTFNGTNVAVSISIFCASANPAPPSPQQYGVNASTESNPQNNGGTITEKGSRWSILSTPAVSVQATASKAAGGATIRHMADCVNYTAGAIAAPVATQLTLNLRDGASGAGSIIWSKTLTIPATAAPHYDFSVCGLNLAGSLNTAMTLEFSALLTNEFESVTLTGYDVF